MTFPLEDELNAKKNAEQPPVVGAASRRASLSGAKKLMENLGIFTSKRLEQIQTSEPSSANGPSPPLTASPLETERKASKSKRTFSFKFRGFGSYTDKQHNSEESHVPRLLGESPLVMVASDPRLFVDAPPVMDESDPSNEAKRELDNI